MKIKILLQLILITIIISCSADNETTTIEKENLPPTLFEISISQITDRSASLTWTTSSDPEHLNITYQIYLNDKLIEGNISNLSYQLNNLNYETNYNGKIISSDGVKTTTVNFSFKTLSFIPLIYNGNVSLTNQQEVINFGKNKYNIINGTLDIFSLNGGSSDINDLTPLLDLMEVRGSVDIKNSSLKSLEGLNNLTKINNNLSIYYNKNLTNINNLENIISIGANLKIYNNDALESIIAFNKVKINNGVINISNNPNLLLINILNNVEIINQITIYSNLSLKNIASFENVKEIKYDLDINNNNILDNISGFKNAATIGGGLYLNNSKVANLSFTNLKIIGGAFELQNNNSLQTLDGINNLTNVNGNYFYIWNNIKLNNFCGISTLVNNNGIKRNLSISGNLFNPTVLDFQNGNCSQ